MDPEDHSHDYQHDWVHPGLLTERIWLTFCEEGKIMSWDETNALKPQHEATRHICTVVVRPDPARQQIDLWALLSELCSYFSDKSQMRSVNRLAPVGRSATKLQRPTTEACSLGLRFRDRKARNIWFSPGALLASTRG